MGASMIRMKPALAQSFYDINKHDSSDKSDDEAIQVESGNAGLTEEGHNPTTDDSSDDTHDNIEEDTLLIISVHQKRCYPTDETSEDNPNDNTHKIVLMI